MKALPACAFPLAAVIVALLFTLGGYAVAKHRATLIGECEPYRFGGCRTCTDCSHCHHCHVEHGECSVCISKQ